MKSAEKISLTKGEWFNYYEMSIIMLIPTLGIGYLSFQNANVLIFVALIPLAVSILLYWLNWKRLFFQEYKFEMTDEQFERAINVTAKELNWQIAKSEKNYTEAIRFPEPLGAYGEKITIKKIENKVLINSTKNPEYTKK